MELEQRLELIQSVGEEILTIGELRELLQTKKHPVAYDGFEPSGNLHIAQGILRAINVNKMLKAGVHFKFWVADWFGWMNNKMDGDLDKIRTVGEYQIEVWKACGMDINKIEFLWAKDVMADDEYWKKVVNIARHTTVNRIIRCSQIMGRSEGDELSSAQIFYPAMQCADIFHLGVDITQLGMDQRKVNVLAREIGPKLGWWKPVVVSHHMLMGLGQPASNLEGADRAIEIKMSKSKPDSAIFMTDSEEEIDRKIKKAYCPDKQADDNPVLEYCRYIIFESTKRMKIERKKEHGGDIYLENYDELAEQYMHGYIHPLDLKKTVAIEINKLIDPVRKHFDKNNKARELYEQVKGFQVTR